MQRFFFIRQCAKLCSRLLLIALVLIITPCHTKANLGIEKPRHLPSRVQAAPDPAFVFQPDGSKIKIYLRGDEWCNWIETEEGYVIAKGADEWWYYVAETDGKGLETVKNESGLRLTNVKADKPPPEGPDKYAGPSCVRPKK